ncbi:Uncharacterised protein [Metamycoplasma arthritidis]|uniref:Uncharacterized protein n=1 Tax=Metamycoplasma arthritidis (strain 158L3-1) TaxID=243272 RepID=B3PNE0_META1|nr:hypothetical protein [Metamycoplasma arthritidis]ACF07542.1 hypothetical protein MARTH_orf809 [Metamycoplasma arthritidis 158L3-1]VEU79050.1 Uncharacterised protein [Metamycoplasma arthritidis]
MILPYELIEYRKIEQQYSKKDKEIIESVVKCSIEEYVQFLELEIFKYNKKFNYKLKKLIICYDGYGNPYVYAEFEEKGHILVSLINNESVLINPLNKKRILNNIDLNKKYTIDYIRHALRETKEEYISAFSLETGFSVKNNPILRNLRKEKFSIKSNLNDKKLIHEKHKIKKQIANYYKKEVPKNKNKGVGEIIYADVELKHSWWFKTKAEGFGYADGKSYSEQEKQGYPSYKEGLCHYVGAAMLLQYAEYFMSRDVFGFSGAWKYMESGATNLSKFPESPTINKYLVLDLWGRHANWAIKTTGAYFKSTMWSFLQSDGKKPSVYVQRRSMGAIWPWKWIDDNKVFMTYGHVYNPNNGQTIGHSIMPYGYYNKGPNKYLAHFGWEDYSQVIVSQNLQTQVWLIALVQNNPQVKPTLRKHFYYEGKYYTGEEATEIFNNKFKK